VAERTGKKALMFNIFRRRNAPNDPGGTQPASPPPSRDSKWGHTLHLLASGGAGVEGAWQEYLDWNSGGELPCDQLGRSVPRRAMPWTNVTSGEEINRYVILARSGVRPILFPRSEQRRG
jgi:hypothetical protein